MREVQMPKSQTEGAGLLALLSEMQALMGILPVRPQPVPQPESGRAEDVARAEEDVVEAGFDNMPV